MHHDNIHIAMIPGINNSAGLWRDIIAELPAWVTAHPVDCPALDNVEAIADALLATLPEQFCLCGFSFGGYVALAMLEKAPERISSLVLMNTHAQADNASQIAMRRQAIARAEAGGHEALVEAQAAKVFHPDSLNQTSIKQARTAMVREYGAERFIGHLKASIARPDRMTTLSQLTIPVLIVAADDDQVITAAHQLAMAEVIPNVTTTRIPEAGHMMPLEKPLAVARSMIDWLDKSQP